MSYLGIARPARPLTVSRRDEGGDVLLARQVPTEPDRARAFFNQVNRDRPGAGEWFAAVVEVCGFNGWLVRLLQGYRSHEVVRIQPTGRPGPPPPNEERIARREKNVPEFAALPPRNDPTGNAFDMTSTFRNGFIVQGRHPAVGRTRSGTVLATRSPGSKED